MKSRPLSFVIMLLCGMMPPCLFSQDSENLNQLIVTGSAVVKKKADQVSFTLSVDGTGQSLAGAVESAKTKTTEVVNALKALGLQESDLTTSHFSEGENPDKMLFSAKKDYKATIEIQVRTDKVNLLEKAILDLNHLKVDVYNIRYEMKDDFELTKQALKQAAEKAREKADLLAKELNAKIDGVLLIEEIQWSNPNMPPSINIRGGRSNESGVLFMDGFEENNLLSSFSKTLFFEENISRNASVRVVFHLTK